MSGLEQAIGALVILGGGFLAVIYGGGFVWYRFVEYPLAVRQAKKGGIVVVGENNFGDSVFVDYAKADWRHATFGEWRKDSGATLWPARAFDEEEFLC